MKRGCVSGLFFKGINRQLKTAPEGPFLIGLENEREKVKSKGRSCEKGGKQEGSLDAFKGFGFVFEKDESKSQNDNA